MRISLILKWLGSGVVLVLLTLAAVIFAAQPTAIAQRSVLAWIPCADEDEEYAHVVEALGFRPQETRTRSASELRTLLSGVSVLLIPEQEDCSESSLRDLGSACASVLQDFLDRGGTIVGMSYARGAEDILRKAGILPGVDDDEDITDETVTVRVVVRGYPLAAGVSSSFTAENGSTDFSGVSGAASIIVEDADGDPVVFVQTVGRGTVVMLGFDFYEYNTNMAALLRNAVAGAPTTEVSMITKYLPATYEFSEQEVSYHMVHFADTQPAGTIILGRSCEGMSNFNVLLTRLYPGGGTFTYMAFDLGRYGSATDQERFVVPFLRGFLEYIENIRGKAPTVVLSTPHSVDDGVYVRLGLEALGVAFLQASSYPVKGAADLIIIAQDGGTIPLPNYAEHLALGHHVLVIGGSNHPPYYESLKLYFNITTDTGWHTCECIPDWIKLWN